MHTFRFVGFFLAYVIEKAELGGQSYLVTSKSVRLRGIGGVWIFFQRAKMELIQFTAANLMLFICHGAVARCAMWEFATCNSQQQ